MRINLFGANKLVTSTEGGGVGYITHGCNKQSRRRKPKPNSKQSQILVGLLKILLKENLRVLQKYFSCTPVKDGEEI